MINVLIKVFLKALNILRIPFFYRSRINRDAPWALISYIPEAIYRKNDTKYMNGHQSRREMACIVNIFNNFGYNVYVVNFRCNKIPNIKFNVIFGLEPCIEIASKTNQDAIKIYYATGAYLGHQNSMIKKRTDEFNRKYKSNYPYQRLVTSSERCEIADSIIQIGSNFTVETYPQHIRNKIITIRQSNTITKDINIIKDYFNKEDFLWLGSAGTLLKGLDLAIEYFTNHKELNLHVVGSIDEKFKSVLGADKIPNIYFYGFMNTSSSQFLEVAKKCNFLIYPSCTEGGCPGSVINSMRYGIIPIVTKWAAFNEIEDYGYILRNLDIRSIEECVNKVKMLSAQEIRAKSKACRDFSIDNYNLNVFKEDFSNALEKCLKKK